MSKPLHKLADDKIQEYRIIMSPIASLNFTWSHQFLEMKFNPKGGYFYWSLSSESYNRNSFLESSLTFSLEPCLTFSLGVLIGFAGVLPDFQPQASLSCLPSCLPNSFL